MKLIVGLGNPDKEYENTFHNLGFMCADKVAQKLGVEFNKTKCRAVIAEYGLGANKILIAKPQTYMNLSGESVRELISFYKIDVKDLIVCFDDFDLEKGSVRFREKGSAGTHNGMRNIIKEIGTENFARIKVGFKPSGENKIPLIDFVLSKISKDDKSIFDVAIDSVASACIDFCNGVLIDSIKQKYNITK